MVSPTVMDDIKGVPPVEPEHMEPCDLHPLEEGQWARKAFSVYDLTHCPRCNKSICRECRNQSKLDFQPDARTCYLLKSNYQVIAAS